MKYTIVIRGRQTLRPFKEASTERPKGSCNQEQYSSSSSSSSSSTISSCERILGVKGLDRSIGKGEGALRATFQGRNSKMKIKGKKGKKGTAA